MPKRGNKDDNMKMEDVGAIAEVHCESKIESYMDNPVVGWLVVIKGKGQGCFVRLGYGINSIGRSNTNRVSLNFGDNEISPERHIVLIYDTRQREFFIQQGEGKTLAYVDGFPLSQSTILEDRSTIEIGETRLKLVTLCGPNFDWLN